MIERADVVIGLQSGDEAKASVTLDILKRGDYTHCMKVNGGPNAGGTFYVNEKKLVLHSIPVGVVEKVKSIIGPGCVLNVELFLKEKEEAEQFLGYSLDGLIYIAENCHIITKEHLEQEANESKIGTTKKGIGPAYTDKYARKGIRASEIPELKPYLIDIKEEFYKPFNECRVLIQGSQGFYLDPDWGDYPYVTSSHCGIGGVINNGIPPNKLNNIIGVFKAYTTYVGAKDRQDPREIWHKIQEVGKEIGATTGRKRKTFPLNLDETILAINMTGCTMCVVKKLDVLEEVNHFEVVYEKQTYTFDQSWKFQTFIESKILLNCNSVISVIFGRSMFGI